MRKNKTEFLCVMVTGMSGSGKSQTIKCLEDFGFFCIDNLPAPLLPSLADLVLKLGNSMQQLALRIDTREESFSNDLNAGLKIFSKRKIKTWVLFLDSNNSTLLRRFSETRRKHPTGKGILEGIHKERKELKEIRSKADLILDTSNLTLSELKKKISSSLPTHDSKKLYITVYSFGFKYGLPMDADLVFDVRFSSKPQLRPRTYMIKQDSIKSVRKYVSKNHEEVKPLKPICLKLIENCIPQFVREGKSHLTIAFGCTGGKHRSVTFAEILRAIS